MSRVGARSRLTGAGYTSRVAQWGQRSLIKSIQRGVVTIGSGGTSATATIAAVDPNNSRLVALGTVPPSHAGGASNDACRLALTNATTITAFVNSTSASDRVVGFEIIEYWPGVIKSIQRGTFTTSSAASGTATVTAVVMAKATLDNLGFTTDDTSVTTVNGLFKLVLTNATTITGNGLSALDRTAGYQLIEWY